MTDAGSSFPERSLAWLQALEASYLRETDPIRQSGFGGGAERWRAERGPILDAIDRSGSILDVGCANGYLLECLVEWGSDRGLTLDPWGLDIGSGLIALAKERHPHCRDHFFVGNAWDWTPPRRFDHVYSLYECVPRELLSEYVRRLLREFVKPAGTLILGAYGSYSKDLKPFDLAGFLEGEGYEIGGRSQGGRPPITSFAWVKAPG